MTDPLGFVNKPLTPGITNGPFGLDRSVAAGPGQSAGKADFASTLLQQINEVNDMQNQANQGAEDFALGKRTVIENVVAGTEKADPAFRMLMALRNKVQAAYDEIKQVRI